MKLFFSWNLVLALICFYDQSQAQEIKRAISLSPAITELVFALKLQSKLVGVSEYSDFPKEALKITSVGPYNKPSFEKIIFLKSDLVLIPQEGPQENQLKLDQLKIGYAVVPMKSISEIGSAARQIAKLLGNEKVGVDFEKKWLASVNASYPKKGRIKKKIKTFMEIQSDPLIVAGGETFLNEAMENCGFENIFGLEKGYPMVSLEHALTEKPDIIFITDGYDSAHDEAEIEKRWHQYPSLSKTNIIFLNSKAATRPGPRFIETIKKICAAALL